MQRPASPLIGHEMFEEIGQFFVDFTDLNHWFAVANQAGQLFWGNLFLTGIWMIIGLLVVAGFQRLTWFNDRTIKRAKRDQFLSSGSILQLMICSALASLLFVSPLVWLGTCLICLSIGDSPDNSFSVALGWSLLAIAATGFVMRLLQEFFSHGGLSEAIHGFKYSNARYVTSRLVSNFYLVMPLLFLIVFVGHYQEGRWIGSIGRFSFLILVLLALAQFQQFCWPTSKLYARLKNDPATSGATWLHLRVPIYIAGMTLLLLTLGLTISGWMEQARTLSLNLAVSVLIGLVFIALRTVFHQRAGELVGKYNFIETLGQSSDSPSTARSEKVKQFIDRNSDVARRGIDLLGVGSYLGVLVWIWRDWIALPPELLQIELGGVALSVLVVAGKLLVIVVVTYFFARELPNFLIWAVGHQLRVELANPAMVAKLLSAVLVYIGLWTAVTVTGVQLPIIPWLGTMLVGAILLAGRELISNGLAGMNLLIDGRVKPGDCVEVDGVVGRVQAVNWFATLIEDNLGGTTFFPNAKLIGQRVTKIREEATLPMMIEVSLPRTADAHQAQAIMNAVAETDPAIIMDPPPHVRFSGFRLNQIRFQIRMLVVDSADLARLKKRIEERLEIEFERHGVIDPEGSYAPLGWPDE